MDRYRHLGGTAEPSPTPERANTATKDCVLDPLLVADWLQRHYHSRVTTVEDLFGEDLGGATELVTKEVLSDVSAALDAVLPRAIHGNRVAVRRYILYFDEAAKTLTDLPADRPQALPPASVIYTFLRNEVLEAPWVAPSVDGQGVMTVLVDRLRGFAAGIRQECVRARVADTHEFALFEKVLAQSLLERDQSAPLRRAMTILDLTPDDVAGLMHVSRQAVGKWLVGGPPTERMQKIASLAEVADILNYRLKQGLVPAIARRPADVYSGKTMLEMIAEDEHESLLESIKRSFDYSQVA